MKRIMVFASLMAVALMACQQQVTVVKPNILGGLEVSLNSDGLSSVRFTTGLQLQGTLRENDVTFSPVGTASVITDGAFDYLQARFTVNNTSGTAFNNLTLYAVAKSANIAGSAIKSITNFGGVDVTDQTRIAKLVLPIHATQLSLIPSSTAFTPTLVQGREDFQAFTNAEVTTLQTDLNNTLGGFSSADKALGYGFVARRCVPNCAAPTSFTRTIPPAQSGVINLGFRIPKQATATAYNFVMTFAVVNETNARVTRSKLSLETLAEAETRLTSVGATANSNEVMQIGLTRSANLSSTRVNIGADDLAVTTDSVDGNTSYSALGLERIDLGSDHSCGLTTQGKAFCWGSGTFRQLGNNSNVDSAIPVSVKTSTGADSDLRFSSISAGSVHTCGISLDGVAYCWGNGSNGMLGNNSTNSTGSDVPKAVQKTGGADSDLRFSSISAGQAHTCGITTEGLGLAFCWGSGILLGNNTTSGDFTVPQAVIAPTGGAVLRFSNISAGVLHTCGMTTTGIAFCWGANSSGQLGTNTITNSAIPVAVKTSTGADSPLRFSSISNGVSHTCGITTTGIAFCWGDGTFGKLGNNATTSSTTPIAVKTSTGADSDLRFSSVSAGNNHTCGLTTNAMVFCWGQGSNGKLGNNTVSNATTPVSIKQPDGTDSPLHFSGIGLGNTHTCGMTTNGLMFCWGNASNGKLGNNTTSPNSLTPTRDAALSFKL